jgi:hypothetical protein
MQTLVRSSRRHDVNTLCKTPSKRRDANPGEVVETPRRQHVVQNTFEPTSPTLNPEPNNLFKL